MSKQNLLTVMALLAVTVLLLGGNVHAGSGTYTDGTPDRLTLNVNFEFDVSPNFNPNINWENTLTRASALLYNSTDGQLQIRTVNFYSEPRGHPLDGRSRGNDNPQEINCFISVSSTRLSDDL
jgi:hypothetical protein